MLIAKQFGQPVPKSINGIRIRINRSQLLYEHKLKVYEKTCVWSKK